MSNDSHLPVSCPHCLHTLATLAVQSETILTMTCANCGYKWSVEVATMPAPVRAAAQILALERDITH